MARKLFLRLDQGSLSGDDIAAIINSSPVSTVDSGENCFQFSFPAVVLDHALLLLGGNNSRFGFDLWHYLYSARGFFSQTADGLLVMPDSTPDFKRRYSEDLGVAVGSLLMVESLDVKWETIAQIPTNKRLTKRAKTPDFIGFDSTGRKRVYECKGTTQPHDVDKHRQKAKQQLADHHEANVTKFAAVTYVPTSPKLIPPFLFVSDPPAALSLMTETLATGIHYLQVCEFAALDRLTEPLHQAIALRLAVEEKIASGEEPDWQMQHNRDAAMRQCKEVVGIISQQSDLTEFQGHRFAGIWRSAQEKDTKIKVLTGVSVDQLTDVVDALSARPDTQEPAKAPRFQTDSVMHGTNRTSFSLFSDGTLLLFEQPAGTPV